MPFDCATSHDVALCVCNYELSEPRDQVKFTAPHVIRLRHIYGSRNSDIMSIRTYWVKCSLENNKWWKYPAHSKRLWCTLRPKNNGGIRKAYLQVKRQHIECCTFTFLNSNRFMNGHQQYGAPPHFSRYTSIMEILTGTFPGRWIGKGESGLWPPRSPDLTPLDFSVWGCVKNYFYVHKIWDLNNLNAGIREAAEQVARDMLQCVW
jgi:hypothetical protein